MRFRKFLFKLVVFMLPPREHSIKKHYKPYFGYGNRALIWAQKAAPQREYIPTGSIIVRNSLNM